LDAQWRLSHHDGREGTVSRLQRCGFFGRTLNRLIGGVSANHLLVAAFLDGRIIANSLDQTKDKSPNVGQRPGFLFPGAARSPVGWAFACTDPLAER